MTAGGGYTSVNDPDPTYTDPVLDYGDLDEPICFSWISTQAGDQEDVIKRFSPAHPEACVLSKLDEATRIGGALSTVIRHGLTINYLCDGQRVPEDIRQARADQLVLRAMQLARQNPALPQDGTLALQYGATHAGH